MQSDPLFLDLRIALDNAEPTRKILLDHLADRGNKAAQLTTSQQALLDAGVAQVIQSLYTAAENLLLKIAASIDGGTPAKDENWHAALLARMSHAFPGRRPVVLSPQTTETLNQLRGFRHVARNTYAHTLDRERLMVHAELAVRLFPLLTADVDKLERYLTSESGPD